MRIWKGHSYLWGAFFKFNKGNFARANDEIKSERQLNRRSEGELFK